RVHEVHRDVLLLVAASDREDQHAVLVMDPAALEPVGEAAVPTFIVDARGELADVVGGRVGLKAADLAEVVHRMASVAGAATDAEDEEPPTPIARLREERGSLLDRRDVDRLQDLDGLA